MKKDIGLVVLEHLSHQFDIHILNVDVLPIVLGAVYETDICIHINMYN